MKKKKFLDTNIDYKSKTVEDKIQIFEYKNLRLPLPTEIEISESGTCNRSCSFCPRSAADFDDKKEFITNDLHEKLCEELKKLNYSGTIRYSGFVEPLLDKNIYNLINMVKKFIPDSNVEMVTNGDPLNLKRLKKLFENGLNKILISAYDGKEDADKLEDLCKKANLSNEQYIVRHRYYSEDQDFGITLSNRSGLMENAEFKIDSLKEPLKSPCYIPSYTFFLDYQGDVLMCPHDWGKKVILGNLNKEDLVDIWFSKKSMKIRKMLNNANRNFAPCNVCDVEGTFMGEKNSGYFN
ncbi:radical SAM/SPASM domain-containing protein [Candidatus Pelagibacter sp. Uisw_099_02]|uniref:radical SAM/SPASM domain-containing protein n=1 Tax=Candidatus Pelagibacter sp. Uisw_099_02 TaxID=3230981 RepID=UPI0039EB18E6|tara:strand:+ start:169 stop:1053 length:885 start_codon:yes stop_codon:yes gene_type:complete